MAAAWFELYGHSVSWPLEPCRYDLLVWMGKTAARVQVKTGKNRTTYDPDEIDYFFVIDGDLHFYLIPVAAVGGLTAILLSAYQARRLSRDAR